MTNNQLEQMMNCARDTNIRVVREGIMGDIDQQEAYTNHKRKLRLIAEEISGISIRKLPLYINIEDSRDPEGARIYRTMVKWRLENGI